MGQAGGILCAGLWLEKKELKGLANWPAGLFGAACWRSEDPEPSRGRPPEPLVVDAGALRCRPTFAEVAPLAEGSGPGVLARLLTALAGAAREGRALFVVAEAGRLGDLAGLLTFAFPEALRPALTFSTYHDRPEELPGFRLQGTVPETRPNREALRALGVVADLAAGTFEPAVAPARWATAVAGWFVHRGPGDGLAWEASDRRARDAAGEDVWGDDRLDRIFGLRPTPKPRPAAPEAEAEPRPTARTARPESTGEGHRPVGLRRLFRRRGLEAIAGAMRATDGAEAAQLADDAWFRTHVIDPAWAAAPLLFRLVGRARLRWDEFFQALRAHAFAITGGRAKLRPDWEQRAARLLDQFRDPEPAAAETPTKPGPAEPEAGVVVGIDLGTTFSVVAYVDRDGRPASVVNSSGDLLTPSVVLFDEDEIVVGKEAVLASAIEPWNVAECVKRDMGSRAYRKPIRGEALPPEVISSLILRKLRADAERRLGPIREAVITVPAYFDEPRRRATADAGRLAGLEVLDVLNEPTAAALAFGRQLGLLDAAAAPAAGKPLTVLVYDLGGGTFDVSIVRIEPGRFRALATDGDVYLGGRDWDEALVNLVAERFRREHREDPRASPQGLQELFLEAERCKRTLTERSRATLFVNHHGTRHKFEVTRAEFEEATIPLLGRTRATTEIVVLQAGLTWAAIDRVLLVGGATRMPMVGRMLEELSGKPPDRSVSADEAVAHGAAMYADLLVKRRGRAGAEVGPSITNVNAHSLGLVGIDPATRRESNEVLIPKNTPLPHSVTRRFRTLKAGQRSVRLRVLEGESEQPDACTRVGDCVIRGLPPDLPASWPIDVRYSYAADGRLRVHGKLVGIDAAIRTEFRRAAALLDGELTLWTRCLEGQEAGPR